MIRKRLREKKKDVIEFLYGPVLRYGREADWANVFHDSIRGRSYLQNLPLNIGRYAGSYPFFYVLNRIIHDFTPERIIEFGLGESSKFISVCLESYLTDATHLVIEQSEEWQSVFEDRFRLSDRSAVKILPMEQKTIHGNQVNCYSGLEEAVPGTFELYVVDGPHGSARYSRYDIVFLAERLEAGDDFIIIIDDVNRKGEKDTLKELMALFQRKQIPFETGHYHGLQSVSLIGGGKYKFIATF